MTQETWARVADRFQGECLGEQEIKGKGAIGVVEILAQK